MIERVLENWLNKASERGYQIPFCQALIGQGKTILHSTRHCAMEMGKDIIAQDSDGFIHVYQLKSLKGAKLTQSGYRSDVAPQLASLVLGKPIHPSIPETAKVKFAYIVMSGDINEEASREIDDLNRTLEQSSILTRVKTITYGELIVLFRQNFEKFGPKDPHLSKLFLELFLSDGRDFFPVEKLATLLEEMSTDIEKPTSGIFQELTATMTLISSLAVSNFTLEKNWFSEFQCWSTHLAHLLQVQKLWEIPTKDIEADIDIALTGMFSALKSLNDECLTRAEKLTEGNPLADSLLHQHRRTILVGANSLYLLWSESLGTLDQENVNETLSFIRNQLGQLSFWGESAVPFILAYIFLASRLRDNKTRDRLLEELICSILRSNAKDSNEQLPSPYYSVNDCLKAKFMGGEFKFEEKFTRSAYTLLPLIMLAVDLDLRDLLQKTWKEISYFSFVQYEPEGHYEFFRWRSKRGRNIITLPKFTQSWTELRMHSQKLKEVSEFGFLSSFPPAFLAFLFIMPYRLDQKSALALNVHFASPPEK